MKKRLLYLLLCVVLAVPMIGVYGCGAGYNDDPNKLTIFRWDFAQVDSARKTRSPIYKKIKEKIDIDIYAVTAGSGNWEGVINNRFNTGSLPDIFVSYAMDRPQVYEKWIKDNAVLPISDYVSETKYPNIYNRLKKFDYLAERLPYAKGKHYAIPIATTLEHGMYVRTDWIRNLNKTEKLTRILTEELGRAPSAAELDQYKFKLPENLIEFYRLARAFSKHDPDGNNKNDTYGYTSSETNMWFNNWIFEAFDSTFFGMVKDGEGGLTSSWITEGNKKAVAYLNRLYCEDILDPDYIATNAEDKNAKFVKGQVGIMVGNIWYNTILNNFKAATGKTDEEAKNCFAVIAPPKGPNGSYGMRGNAGFWCATSIRKNMSAEKREKALTLLDFLLSDEGNELFTYGIEGVHYKTENGEKVSLMGSDSTGFNYTVESKDPAFALSSLVDWTKSYYMPFQTNGEIIEELMDNAKTYARIDPVVYVQTPRYIEKEQTLGSNSITSFVSMISNNTVYSAAGYNKTAIPEWNDLVKFSSAYDSAWSSFTNQFNNDWGGAAMIKEYSAEAKKYL